MLKRHLTLKVYLSIAILVMLLFNCSNPIDKKSIIQPVDQAGGAIQSDTALQNDVDDYGMKKYVLAFLKRGPIRNQDSASAADIQRAHLDNITKMAENGQLVLAGPFLDTGEIRGIYIFNVATIEEARRLTETDPAIQSGRLEMELHAWYGSAALLYLNELHKKIAKKDI